jgi:hypothetical protein
MKTWIGLALFALLVPGGLLAVVGVFVRRRWRRYRVRTEIGKAPGADYMARWRNFHTLDPQIAPANLPAVTPLKAETEGATARRLRFPRSA